MDIINCQYTYVTFSLFSSTTSIKKVNEILNLKDGQVLITIITLGYAKEETPTNKLRKDFNKVVFSEKIGNPL